MSRVVVAALSAFTGIVLAIPGKPLSPRHIALAPATSAGSGSTSAPESAGCPPGTIPDEDVCVHVPSEDELDALDALVSPNLHRERSGRWAIYDQIPRRPDRPADYDAYRYPVPPGLPNGHSVVSGYDLDRPDPAQRRGRTLHAVGHGGVDLPQAKGTPIKFVPLEHQQGDADVLYVGPYFGNTVITRDTVREGGQLRDYLLVFGHLDAAAPGLAAGATVKEDDIVGTVGDTGSPELVHLHLEARRVRDGVDAKKRAALGPGALMGDDASIVCDPRNVLPLRK